MSVGVEKRQRSDQFTFKRFQIDQTDCAMRISSDATIFGAYIAVENAKTILDIGTGTGLLALMVAQRAHPEARIDAVEISPVAFARAKENAAASPFADMINPINQSIQEFALQSHKRYELFFPIHHFIKMIYLRRLKTRPTSRGIRMKMVSISPLCWRLSNSFYTMTGSFGCYYQQPRVPHSRPLLQRQVYMKKKDSA